MSIKKSSKFFLLLAVFALFAAACGSDDDDAADDDSAQAAATTAAPAAAADDDMSDDDMADDDMSLPGEGVDVTMARATWSTGYFQAEVYASLMRELGYNVSEPAEAELANDVAYVSMAQGDITFWVNSWYPGHRKFLKSELTDGSLVEDSVTAIGEELVAGGLQGLLISKDFADEYGITTLEDLNSNADAIAALDAVDGDPGNGVGNIYGCPESWTCDDIIQSQLAFAGLDNLKQILAGYDAMFAAALDDVNAGRPAVIYTWTPSAYVTQLLPGKNVYWIGYESILDDSNPLGLEGGAELSQVPGTGAIPEASCPAAADNADGLCPIGWIAADILVTANNDFLDDNPAARQLFEDVKLSVIDVSLANVAQGDGAEPKDLAAAWIVDNRDTVDAWLSAARAAA